MKTESQSVEAYIASFPAPVQQRLKQIRAIIRKAATDATEKISYQMPAFMLNGSLLYYAAYEHHIGLYNASSAVHELKGALLNYETGKGTLRFPLEEPLPVELIQAVAAFRVAENRAAAVKKKAPKR